MIDISAIWENIGIFFDYLSFRFIFGKETFIAIALIFLLAIIMIVLGVKKK